MGKYRLLFLFVIFIYYSANHKSSGKQLVYSLFQDYLLTFTHLGTKPNRLVLTDAVYCKELRHLPLQEIIINHYPESAVNVELIRSFIRKQDINRAMQAVLLLPTTEAEGNATHKNKVISSLILLLLKIQTKSYIHYKESLLLHLPRFQDPVVQAVINSIICFIEQTPCEQEFLPSNEASYDLLMRQLPYENTVKLIVSQHQRRDTQETSLVDCLALVDALKLDTQVLCQYIKSISLTHSSTHTHVGNEDIFALRVLEDIQAAASSDEASPEYELLRGYLLGHPPSNERNSYMRSLGGLRRYSSWRSHQQNPVLQRILQQNIAKKPHLLLSRLSAYCARNSTVVVLGDGDFSFTTSLLTSWPTASPRPHIITTTISEEEEFAGRYVNASLNIHRIVTHHSAKILYGVDVTKAVPTATSDRVLYLFNFPYADTTRVSSFDTVWMRSGRHIELLTQCLRNIYKESMSRDVTVFITLTGEQLYSWQVGHVLQETSYELVDAVPFNATEWCGYERTRSNINSKFPLVSSWTLIMRPHTSQ